MLIFLQTRYTNSNPQGNSFLFFLKIFTQPFDFFLQQMQFCITIAVVIEFFVVIVIASSITVVVESSFSVTVIAHHCIASSLVPPIFKAFKCTAHAYSTNHQGVASYKGYVLSLTSIFAEYAINVTSDTLNVTFIPSNGSVVPCVNAIKVVSMPTKLFVDHALALNPIAPFNGLC
ncbi:hypothetical protein V8G54_024661 [Vigna mungo]|uniref:Uncharacterized protein n=1 Tax=Vigna mungo TaxID=3915 RepID=A0AAQ3N580_VIGMU